MIGSRFIDLVNGTSRLPERPSVDSSERARPDQSFDDLISAYRQRVDDDAQARDQAIDRRVAAERDRAERSERDHDDVDRASDDEAPEQPARVSERERSVSERLRRLAQGTEHHHRDAVKGRDDHPAKADQRSSDASDQRRERSDQPDHADQATDNGETHEAAAVADASKNSAPTVAVTPETQAAAAAAQTGSIQAGSTQGDSIAAPGSAPAGTAEAAVTPSVTTAEASVAGGKTAAGEVKPADGPTTAQAATTALTATATPKAATATPEAATALQAAQPASSAKTGKASTQSTGSTDSAVSEAPIAPAAITTIAAGGSASGSQDPLAHSGGGAKPAIALEAASGATTADAASVGATTAPVAAAKAGGSTATQHDAPTVAPPLPSNAAPGPAPVTEAARVAPTPPAAPPAPAVDPWQQVVEVLRPLRQFSDGSHRLSIRLSPEDFGTVNIELSLHRGDLHLHLVADNPSATAALTESLHLLRADLEASGVRTGSMEVGQHGQQQNQPRPGDSTRSGSLPAAADAIDVTDSLSEAPAVVDGRLDVRI